MEPFSEVNQLRQSIAGVLKINTAGEVKLIVPRMFEGEFVERLARTSALAPGIKTRKTAAFYIRAAAEAKNIWFDSLSVFYEHSCSRKFSGLVIPAFNIPGMTFSIARIIFRSYRKYNTGPFIFQLSPLEMADTAQTPWEYSACILAAAMRERYSGPIFIQCNAIKLSDHISPDSSPDRFEPLAILLKDCINAGFYHFVLDDSVIDSLEQSELFSCADFGDTWFSLIRKNSPRVLDIQTGIELVKSPLHPDKQNDLEQYTQWIQSELIQRQAECSVSKILRPFELCENGNDDSEKQNRSHFHVAYCERRKSKSKTQQWTETGVQELHSRRLFQDIIFDHPEFPLGLKEQLRVHLTQEYTIGTKPDWTDDQFYTKLRSRAWRSYKKALWSLDDRTKAIILGELEKTINHYFASSRLENAFKWTNRNYKQPVAVPLDPPELLH